MCFCAEASFTVGSVLGVVGVSILRNVTAWSLKMLALIPLLFGIQQFAEGVIWLNMNDEMHRTLFSEGAVFVFLMIAWVVWPVYCPLAVLIPETVPWKRIACVVLLICGLYVSYVDFYYLYTKEITPTVFDNSIRYAESPYYGSIFYAVVTVTPTFISSVKRLWFVGLLALITFVISQLIYAETFTSVWCFFAAAISILLFKVLYEENAKVCKIA